MEMQHVTHTIPPLYNEKSQILILGSFPSVKSREGNFFYNHPQNRFWRVLAGVLQVEVPDTIAQKKAMLLQAGIAVYDVVYACDIIGSSDSSIRNVTPSNLKAIIEQSHITRIYTNGNTADKLYQKYCLCNTGIKAVKLPSTSPANAAWTLERLIEAWRIIDL